MTITTDSSAPLFVVVGATGSQGRAVINAIHNDTSTHYRIRALTRDTSKPAAKELEKLGCELAVADLEDREALEKAMKGASVVFAMTVSDYWSADGEEKEYQEGMRVADAAKTAGAATLIFSGLPNLSKLSNGKNAVWSFDVKARIVDYARSLSNGDMKVIDVQPASFASNYWTNAQPRKTPDGNYILPLAYAADTLIPVIDIEADYGRFVFAALKSGTETVIAASQYVTPIELANAFSDFKGEKVTFVPLSDDTINSILLGVGGKTFADCLTAMYKATREVGYYGGADIKPSNALLDSPARTFAQSLAGHREAVEKMFSSL